MSELISLESGCLLSLLLVKLKLVPNLFLEIPGVIAGQEFC